MTSLFGNDARRYGLLHHLVGHANHFDLLHPVKRADGPLDFARRYIFAAADNHLFQPAGDMEFPVGIQMADIPRFQPAARRKGFSVRLRKMIVTLHHIVAFDLNFTVFVQFLDGSIRNGTNANADKVNRLSRRSAFLFRGIVPIRNRHTGGGFRLAVRKLKMKRWKPFTDFIVILRRNRRPGDNSGIQKGRSSSPPV
ncbi:hypothetical protein A7X67_12210 [Clostridium sp. W14A]|nr:hypothetical protein A7X67_12210 [Clostridium sp. W14A]